MAEQDVDRFFIAILAQNEYLGLVGLGKLADPATNEIAVDLHKAQIAIGTLQMLERKTQGNLTEAEQQELRRVLTNLRLNYVEEAKRTGEGSQTGDDESGPETAGDEAAGADDPATDQASKETEGE